MYIREPYYDWHMCTWLYYMYMYYMYILHVQTFMYLLHLKLKVNVTMHTWNFTRCCWVATVPPCSRTDLVSSSQTLRSCVSFSSRSRRAWLVARRLLSVFNSDMILKCFWKKVSFVENPKIWWKQTFCNRAGVPDISCVVRRGRLNPSLPWQPGCHGYQPVVTSSAAGWPRQFAARKETGDTWKPVTETQEIFKSLV